MSERAGQRDHEGRTIDFGRTAADYERFRPGFPESFFERLMNDGWVVPGQRALDLGTGTGTLALGLASRGLDVTGLDISPELLTVARKTAADRGLVVDFVEGRAESTGLDDESFGLVTAGQCWWWFDPPRATLEAKRILGSGGRIVICSFTYMALGENVGGRTDALILEHNPGWRLAGWRGVHPEQVKALDAGGFTGVESFSYTIDVPFTHEAWRGRMRTCNGVGSALNDDQVEAFDTALAELLAKEFPGQLSVPHRIFATSGIKP